MPLPHTLLYASLSFFIKDKHAFINPYRHMHMCTVPGEPGGGIMSFVGCHMDVVTANPETWEFDPFKLQR